nr:Tn3 family transposase [Paraburkholderia unamae]
MLEIDSATRFSWILPGRERRSRIELLMVYSAVLAHGTSLSASDISRMVPEISPTAIRQMMNRLEDERVLRLSACSWCTVAAATWLVYRNWAGG